jgi:hypothetical protein
VTTPKSTRYGSRPGHCHPGRYGLDVYPHLRHVRPLTELTFPLSRRRSVTTRGDIRTSSEVKTITSLDFTDQNSKSSDNPRYDHPTLVSYGLNVSPLTEVRFLGPMRRLMTKSRNVMVRTEVTRTFYLDHRLTTTENTSKSLVPPTGETTSVDNDPHRVSSVGNTF